MQFEHEIEASSLLISKTRLKNIFANLTKLTEIKCIFQVQNPDNFFALKINLTSHFYSKIEVNH